MRIRTGRGPLTSRSEPRLRTQMMRLPGLTWAATWCTLSAITRPLQAFDQAFTIGLPQRMTRYQFWPFSAYFNADRIDYLLELTENTYKPINGNYSEEALLWHGYALLRKGDREGALADWNKALKVHPDYCDAEKAINDYIQPTYSLTGMQSMTVPCRLLVFKSSYGVSVQQLLIDCQIDLWYYREQLNSPDRHSYPERRRERPCDASTTELVR